ncbi:E3 ubiquitin-protein ligase rnf130 [Clonorchis sinensis]|uniref:E3 ubiquitin-protein ligase rnf130 n=1 Tax=Clonorchis sinensis TaxID=79923 RepID=A0A8T1MPI1_CLOSI|nr:E3 ubiquitin-protein ligase rnf130 [Clonorchis sinensis]
MSDRQEGSSSFFRRTAHTTETTPSRSTAPRPSISVSSSSCQSSPIEMLETRSFATQTQNTRDNRCQTDLPVFRPLVIHRTHSVQVNLEPVIDPEEEARLQLLYQLQQELMECLPLKMLTQEEARKYHECLICLDEYRAADVTMTLPCFHLLHERCARNWFQAHLTCPACRCQFVTLD